MRRSVQILAASATALIWLAPIAAPTRAVTDQIKTTMSVSPKVVWSSTEVIYTATVAPVSNPVANLVFHFQSNWQGGAAGACAPVEYCTVPDTGPRWDFPLLSSKVTVTFDTIAQDPSRPVVFSLEGPPDSSCYGPCGSVAVAWPTVTSRVTVSPAGVVMPGDTLHVVVSSSINVTQNTGPTAWGEGVVLSAGLGQPTNIDPTMASPPWSWYPASNAIMGEVPWFIATSTKWVEFDTVVTAAIGSKVTIHGFDQPDVAGYTLVNKRLTILVGPQPTATPRPTPKPTPKATGGSRTSPSVTTPAAPTVAPSAGNSEPVPSDLTPSAVPGGQILVPQSAAAGSMGSSPADGPVPIDGSPANANSPSGIVLLLVGVITAGALLALRFAGLRRPKPGP